MLELRDGRRCYPEAVVGVNSGLAFVDALIAFLAFYQLVRIHSRNSRIGWTRQKVFHAIIGSSNLGNFLYFVLALVAACKDWICWSHSCGFIAMAVPRILFIAAFLLLLSFWVDLCHQSYDDDEDDGYNPQELLLDKTNNTDSKAKPRRRCCTMWSSCVGSRQKVVILVTAIIVAIMIASSVLMLIGKGNHLHIESAVIAQVYVDLIAVVILLLGGALAFYGLILFLKMRRVRSDRSSSEMQKVAGLAVVSVISFTSSALVAICTNIPLFYHWHEREVDGLYTSLLLVLYYFIGSSLPSAFILFVMREMPPPAVHHRPESGTITFVSDGSVAPHYSQRWTAVASAQNQVSRASPI